MENLLRPELWREDGAYRQGSANQSPVSGGFHGGRSRGSRKKVIGPPRTSDPINEAKGQDLDAPQVAFYQDRPTDNDVMAIYDLRDAEAWDSAILGRKGWGWRYSYVEVLDSDHIAIAFMPGGARELPA